MTKKTYTRRQFLELVEEDKEKAICLLIKHTDEDATLYDEMEDSCLVDEAEWYTTLIREVGVCKFCDEPVGPDYHLHQGGFVGDDCCWDPRLKSTE